MDNLSKLRGQIERITFANEENGFTIAKMKVQGEKELVTIVGNFPGINPGEVMELMGAGSKGSELLPPLAQDLGPMKTLNNIFPEELPQIPGVG